MKSKLENLPRYQTESVQLDSGLYNTVRLALIRKNGTFRFSVPGLQHIDIILEEDCWVCVDASLNDIPVFAWTEFETKDRDNLHLPINCKLYSYHAHANLLFEPVTQHILSQLGK